MSGRFSVLVVLCIVLFGAILAGYWDMLDSEKLRSIREQAGASVAGITGQDAGAEPPAAAAPTPASPGPPAPRSSAALSPAEPSSPEPSAATGSAPAAAAPPPIGSEDTASATDPATEPAVTPSFDILRVEPDGSAVLAGRAGPNSQVRIVDGERVLGTATATAEGAFAVVLDPPLAAGNHQIRIESQPAGGPTATSVETAIVSVPRSGDPGELLAMVESPNRPARLITLPEGPAAEAASPAPPGVPDASSPPRDPASQAAASAAPTDADAANDGGAVTPPEPAPLPATSAPSPFAVEAVEIENGSIYIAGRAPGREPVQVYVDNRLVGEDRARANGRFLVTAKVPLTAGDHQIRADMIGPDGLVASRVEVPFAKPEGETMSAIASNDAAPSAGPDAAAPAGAGGGAPSPDTGSAVSGSSPAPAPVPAPAPGLAPAPDEPAGGASGAATAEGQGGVATVLQPALEGVKARVLIRRGDTLWRISRQNYGLGRRYTVIYLANGDQIRNPDRIYPGQVFRLPKDEQPDEAVR